VVSGETSRSLGNPSIARCRRHRHAFVSFLPFERCDSEEIESADRGTSRFPAAEGNFLVGIRKVRQQIRFAKGSVFRGNVRHCRKGPTPNATTADCVAQWIVDQLIESRTNSSSRHRTIDSGFPCLAHRRPQPCPPSNSVPTRRAAAAPMVFPRRAHSATSKEI
jgi:hypothetical protein